VLCGGVVHVTSSPLVMCVVFRVPHSASETDHRSVASFSTGADVVTTGAGGDDTTRAETSAGAGGSAGAGAGGGVGAGAGGGGVVSPSRAPSVTVQRIVDRHRASQTHTASAAALNHRASLTLPKMAVRSMS